MKLADLGRLMTGKTFWLNINRLIVAKLLIMANSGGGKSWTIRKLVEIIYGKCQIIILDAEGEFETLRERMDFILAGPDGDVQADPRYAEVLARKVLELRTNLIVNLFELDKVKRLQFVALFLDAMTNAPKKLWHPVVLILDEAHEFAPEKGGGPALAAVQRFASKGRKRGFCLVAATQRLAKLNKDVATECQNKLIGLANWNIDRQRAADELGFVGKDQIMTLRDVKPGEFYAVGPAFPRDVNKVTIGQVKTKHFEAGAHGHGRHRVPAPTAKVRAVLAKLKDLPKDAEKEAQDILGLRSQVHQLEAILRQAKTVTPTLMVPAMNNRDLQLAHERGEKFGYLHGWEARGRLWLEAVNKMKLSLSGIGQAVTSTTNEMEKAFLVKAQAYGLENLQRVSGALPPDKKIPWSLLNTQKHSVLKVKVPALGAQTFGDKASKPKWHSNTSIADHPGHQGLGKCERSILAFLSIHPGQFFDVRTAGAMSGYRPGGTINNAFGRLHQMGYINRQPGQVALKPNLVVPPDLIEGYAHTLDHWIAKLGKCERLIFELVKSDPNRIWGPQEVLENIGYSAGGTVNNAVGRLNVIGLIQRHKGQGIGLHPNLIK